MTAHRLRATAAAAITAAALSSCAHPRPADPPATASAPLSVAPYPAGEGPTGRAAGPAPLSGSAAAAVALAAVKALRQADTAHDADPNDTARRAAAWLTPGFAAQVRAFPPVAAPGASWNLWTRHHAYLAVTTSLAGDDHPPDTAAAAYRQVVAVLHPIGRDGWRGPATTEVVFVTLAPVHGRWRLASARSS